MFPPNGSIDDPLANLDKIPSSSMISGLPQYPEVSPIPSAGVQPPSSIASFTTHYIPTTPNMLNRDPLAIGTPSAIPVSPAIPAPLVNPSAAYPSSQGLVHPYVPEVGFNLHYNQYRLSIVEDMMQYLRALSQYIHTLQGSAKLIICRRKILEQLNQIFSSENEFLQTPSDFIDALFPTPFEPFQLQEEHALMQAIHTRLLHLRKTIWKNFISVPPLLITLFDELTSMMNQFTSELALYQTSMSIIAALPHNLQRDLRLCQAVHGYLLTKQLLADMQTAYVRYIKYPLDRNLDVRHIATALWELLNDMHMRTYQLHPVFSQINALHFENTSYFFHIHIPETLVEFFSPSLLAYVRMMRSYCPLPEIEALLNNVEMAANQQAQFQHPQQVDVRNRVVQAVNLLIESDRAKQKGEKEEMRRCANELVDVLEHLKEYERNHNIQESNFVDDIVWRLRRILKN